MPIGPNQYAPNYTVFNPAVPGTTYASPGFYYLAWLEALGGTLALLPGNTGFNVVMPFTNGSPVPIPDDLNASLLIWKESVVAAALGVTYPAPPPSCPQ